MPMVRAMRMLNAIEAGTTTGAQLQTLLTADPGRLAELNVLMGMRGQSRRMAASSTAMTAVAASSTAMTAVAASSTAMNAVIASSTAMNAVAASSTAMTAVAASSTATDSINASKTASTAVFNGPNAGLFLNQLRIRGGQTSDATLAGLDTMTAVAASSTAMTAVAASSTAMNAVIASSTAMNAVAASSPAKMAVFNSDTAINAIAVSAIALQSIRAATQYVIFSTGPSAIMNVTPGTLVGTNASGSYLAVGVSTSDVSPSATITLATRRIGSGRNQNIVTASEYTSATTALGPICLPIVSPFTFLTTDPTSQVGYVGMLRCDI